MVVVGVVVVSGVGVVVVSGVGGIGCGGGESFTIPCELLRRRDCWIAFQREDIGLCRWSMDM